MKIKPLSEAEILQINYDHFIRTHHAPSTKVGNPEACAYRGRSGAKCAIGCVLPDALYQPKMDEPSQGPDELIEQYPLVATLFSKTRLHFLRALQELHDGLASEGKTATFRAAYKSGLAELARDWQIDWSPNA